MSFTLHNSAGCWPGKQYKIVFIKINSCDKWTYNNDTEQNNFYNAMK